MKLKLPGIEGEINKDDYDALQKISSGDLVGIIGGDWLKLWRWNNLLKIANRIRKKCESENLDPQKVAPKFLSQFFEAASLEDNETLQEMWVNLLLNNSTGSRVNGHYITILKDLEPYEAQILDFLFRNSNLSTSTIFDFGRVLATCAQKISINELEVLIQKLYGFNILRPPVMKEIVSGKHSPGLETIDMFRFSEMGIDFCKKCMGIDL